VIDLTDALEVYSILSR